LGVSCNPYRHQTKSSNTTAISNTHNNNLSSLFKHVWEDDIQLSDKTLLISVHYDSTLEPRQLTK
jgi:hypothetical protein